MSNQFVLDPPWANPGNRGDYGPDATEEDLEKAKAEQEEAEADDDTPDNVRVVNVVNLNFFPEGPASESFVTIVGDPAILEQAKAAAKDKEENPPEDKPETDEMGNPIISEGEGTPNEEQTAEEGSEDTTEGTNPDSEGTTESPSESETPPKSTTTDNYLT